MDIVISNADPKPIYEQIRSQLEDMILTGSLKPNDQLPSIRALANELHVSVITTKRAYSDLEAAGLIQSVQGKGCFVAAEDRAAVKEERIRRLRNAFQNLADEARSAGLEKELRQIVKDCMES